MLTIEMQDAITTSFEEARGDVMTRTMFVNGWGVSVARHSGSYGGRNGLFEVAVIDGTGELRYDTPITGDVIGWCDAREVAEICARVADLTPAL